MGRVNTERLAEQLAAALVEVSQAILELRGVCRAGTRELVGLVAAVEREAGRVQEQAEERALREELRRTRAARHDLLHYAVHLYLSTLLSLPQSFVSFESMLLAVIDILKLLCAGLSRLSTSFRPSPSP